MTALDRHYRIWLLLIWLASAATMITVSWGAIQSWHFPDPDDAMRLAEVRDWMAGQSWFDVSQHRMNLPAGLSMHWSRWLDVPLAGLITLLKPLLGQRAAETVAMVAVPLVTLGATQALVAGIARHRAGAVAGLLAAACCLLSIGAWYAMRPLRIDHHGWQIVAGLGLVLALIARRDGRGAVFAGLCAAAWVHISLEGLAFTAGAAAWLGLRWIFVRNEGYRLPIFLGTLASAELALYLSVHGFSLIHQTFCDQFSPVHLAALSVAALLTFSVTRFAPQSPPIRLWMMAVAALMTGALYRFCAPQCAGGPFAMLGPLGYHLWYLNVPEGVPLWHLGRDIGLLWGLFPWIGLAGATVACLRSTTNRAEAIDYAALLAIATAIGMLVTRAGAFANLLAIPGAITVILLLIARTEPWPLPARIFSRTVAILALCPAGVAVAAMLASKPAPAAPASATKSDPRCGLPDSLKLLDALPRTTILAPLDLGPTLLIGTHQATVTGPYHRDPQALEDVLRFFTAGDAHAIALRRHAGYVAFCANDGEMAAMAKFAPHGLAAALLHNRAPSWLWPIPLTGSASLKLYSINPIGKL
jgi:hypothetical protein